MSEDNRLVILVDSSPVLLTCKWEEVSASVRKEIKDYIQYIVRQVGALCFLHFYLIFLSISVILFILFPPLFKQEILGFWGFGSLQLKCVEVPLAHTAPCGLFQKQLTLCTKDVKVISLFVINDIKHPSLRIIQQYIRFSPELILSPWQTALSFQYSMILIHFSS